MTTVIPLGVEDPTLLYDNERRKERIPEKVPQTSYSTILHVLTTGQPRW